MRRRQADAEALAVRRQPPAGRLGQVREEVKARRLAQARIGAQALVRVQAQVRHPLRPLPAGEVAAVGRPRCPA